MKNILAIEIKDNKTIVTLTKLINGNHNLLLHKSYDSRPLAVTVLFDISIIEKIKEDLLKMNMFESIDEAFLTINTKRVITQTFSFEFKYNTDIEAEKKKLNAELEKKYKNLTITELAFSNTDRSLIKKEISATAEFVEKEYLEEIVRQFKHNGIIFTKIVPLIRSILNSTKTQSTEEGVTLSILVEEKFTQLTTVYGGKINSSIKWDTGLTDVYEHISKMMYIDKGSAKKLFKSFGSIPPEDVIDNKVIHTRKHEKELEIFTKKDLSGYITEKINELFSNVKSKVDPLKETSNIRIIFNGEIKSLIGFKKYAANAFAEPNIKNFTTEVIGLNEETEFITMGTLNESKKDYNNNDVNEEISTQKINIFNKLLRMYNYI